MSSHSLKRHSSLADRMPGWLRIDRSSVILLITIAIAYLPLLLRLARWLWNRDHYSFFPFALVACGGLFYSALAEPGDVESRGLIRKSLFRIAFLILLAATLLVSPWLCGVSGMFMLLSLTYAVGGPDVTKRALPAWLLLWMVIPLPLSLDREIILSLQHFATRLSSGLLDLFGYRHVVSGVVLRLPSRIYHVEEACSGIQSLFSALFCTGVYCVLNRAGILRSLLLVAIAFLWVIVANVGRISAVVVLKESLDLPVDVGGYHAALGFVFFALTMIAVFSTERMMNFVWPTLSLPYWEYRSDTKAATDRSGKTWKKTSFSDYFNPREITSLVILFGLIALMQTYSIVVGGAFAVARVSDISLLAEREGTTLPDPFHGWSQVDYRFIERDGDDINGAVSRLWIMAKDGMRLEASIDGPYVHGWHYLSDCYRGEGWKDSNETYISYRDYGEDRGGDFLTFDLAKPAEAYGMVVTGLFDGDYRGFVAPDVQRMQRHLGRLNDIRESIASLFGNGDPTVARSDSLSFQIQVFYHGSDPLSDKQREACLSFFHDFRRHLTETSP